jgi:urease subunit beta
VIEITVRQKTETKAKKISKAQAIKRMIPGEYILSSEPVVCNINRKTIKVIVKNTGDRPCQIGSHTHFFEINKALHFPREQTFGYRLNIPAGTSVRFEPGDSKQVELCELGGKRISFGFNGLSMGSLKSTLVKNSALAKARSLGFKGTAEGTG